MREIKTSDSSNIEKVQYEDLTRDMKIFFKQGGAYNYKEVPLHIFEAFRTEPSAGKYFHREIRNKFECKKIL